MSGTPPTIFVYDGREPLWLSTARDAMTFGWLIGAALALNKLMPPSGWLNAGLAIAWFLWMVGRGIKLRQRMTPDEARVWLDQHYPASRPTDTPSERAVA